VKFKTTSWEMKCARCGRFYLRFIPPVPDGNCDCGAPWNHVGGTIALDGPMSLFGESASDCGGLLIMPRGAGGWYDMGAPGGSVSISISITVTAPRFDFDAGMVRSFGVERPSKT
jgi:hypothetical protein